MAQRLDVVHFTGDLVAVDCLASSLDIRSGGGVVRVTAPKKISNDMSVCLLQRTNKVDFFYLNTFRNSLPR